MKSKDLAHVQNILDTTRDRLEERVCSEEQDCSRRWVYGCIGCYGTDKVSVEQAEALPWTLSSYREWKSLHATVRRLAAQSRLIVFSIAKYV